MSVALLSIGNELLRGEIANTNGQWLASQLTDLGVEVGAIEAIPDDVEVVSEALRRLAEQHTFVVVTGGLGPTSDDLTAEAAAHAAGKELRQNDDALAAVRRRLQSRGREMRDSHHKMAKLPAGCELIANPVGFAPGFIVRMGEASCLFLPGVPDEMKAMFSASVGPRVRAASNTTVFHILLHTVGKAESWVAEQLEGIEQNHPGVTFRYRTSSPEVSLIIEARGTDPAEVREIATDAAADARTRLGPCVYGEGTQTMPQLAGKSVRTRGWRLAVAESCTGGLIAKQLTSHPASDFFVGGAVAYANSAKTELLGVSADTIRFHGAVSAEVAAEMADGARRAFDCDVAISVTGIAGPTGGTEDKPLGLCHWAVSSTQGTVCEHRVFTGSRNQVQRKAAHAVLDLLRRTVSTPVPAERPSRVTSEELSG